MVRLAIMGTITSRECIETLLQLKHWASLGRTRLGNWIYQETKEILYILFSHHFFSVRSKSLRFEIHRKGGHPRSL